MVFWLFYKYLFLRKVAVVTLGYFYSSIQSHWKPISIQNRNYCLMVHLHPYIRHGISETKSFYYNSKKAGNDPFLNTNQSLVRPLSMTSYLGRPFAMHRYSEWHLLNCTKPRSKSCTKDFICVALKCFIKVLRENGPKTFKLIFPLKSRVSSTS